MAEKIPKQWFVIFVIILVIVLMKEGQFNVSLTPETTKHYDCDIPENQIFVYCRKLESRTETAFGNITGYNCQIYGQEIDFNTGQARTCTPDKFLEENSLKPIMQCYGLSNTDALTRCFENVDREKINKLNWDIK